jgi:outer membrane protein assembly factor BamA
VSSQRSFGGTGVSPLRMLAYLGLMTLGFPALAQAPADAPVAQPAPEITGGPDTQAVPLPAQVPPTAVEPVRTTAPVGRTGWGFQGMPLFNYNSDTGVGYGAALMLVDRADGSYSPFRYSLFLQFFQTTRGIAAHWLTLDAPAFLHSSWRLGVDLLYSRSKFTPYYGLGNSSQYVSEYDTCSDRDSLTGNPDQCPGNPDFRGVRYYSYDLESLPRIQLNARRQLTGPWSLLLGYRLRMEGVRTLYAEDDLGQSAPSKLVEDAQAGLLVGFEEHSAQRFSQRTAELTAGLVYDSRDLEAAPTSGMFHELAVRGAAAPLGSAFNYWGASLQLRGYYAPIPSYRNLVLTGRTFLDITGGNVPFTRLSTFGGLESKEGVGGVSSARGILRNRFQGPAKLLLNAEARWSPLSLPALGQTFDFSLVGFLDAGRAWSDLHFAEGGGLKSAAGGGLHIAWNQDFLVRFDYGIGLSEPTGGFYIEFGQFF